MPTDHGQIFPQFSTATSSTSIFSLIGRDNVNRQLATHKKILKNFNNFSYS